MQSKSFTLAISLAIALSAATLLRAQTPVPTPPTAYLRFWDLCPPAAGAFVLGKADPDSKENFATATGYSYGSYRELPVGRYHLGVFRSPDRKNPLKTFDLDLKGDSFATISIVPNGANVSVDLADDTQDRKSASGTILFRNFFPGVIVSAAISGKTIVKCTRIRRERPGTGVTVRAPPNHPAHSTAKRGYCRDGDRSRSRSL